MTNTTCIVYAAHSVLMSSDHPLMCQGNEVDAGPAEGNHGCSNWQESRPLGPLCTDLTVLQSCLGEAQAWGSQWRKAAHHTRKQADPSRNLTRGHIQAVLAFSPAQASCSWPTRHTTHLSSHHITSHYTTLHHVTSHHITSHHITPHHITSRHITSHHCYITSHHITCHHTTSHATTPHHTHHVTSHHITSHHIKSHHITSHHWKFLYMACVFPTIDMTKSVEAGITWRPLCE